MNLGGPRRIHIVGVGGAGMSAIATVLAAMGHSVSGSDQAPSAVVDRLVALGVDARVGHEAAHVEGVDVVAVSTAIRPTNPEVVAALAAGIPVVRRAEILAAIAAERRTVAVSGTHGKTTTTAMLATVLLGAGLDPGFIVGGDLVAAGGGARWSGGDLFVVEADESDGTFTQLPAEVAVVTNVEADHLDHFGTLANIEAAFETFLGQAKGPTVACADDPGAARLGRAAGSQLYGLAPDADFRIADPRTDRSGVHFDLFHHGHALGSVSVPVPGLHNARNATAAIAAAMAVGARFEDCATALAGYQGVARRFQRRGEAGGVTVVDDYAHNPGKVRALLESAAGLGWPRVVCVFQPHRYSRTADLLPGFADAFGAAGVLGVMDVYGAGEEPRPGVTGKSVVDAVLDRHPWHRVAWVPAAADVLVWLRAVLRPGDLCLTVGAGDVTALGPQILAMLEQRGVRPAGEHREAIEEAAAALGDLARREVPVGPLTTYRVGGAARLFVTIDGEGSLEAVAKAVAASGVPVLVVGKGSNLLVADGGFDGLALQLGEPYATVAPEAASGLVEAAGAALLPVVARRTVAAGLTGFEWAVGVPGSIGGAVRMNAGGHGSDTAATLVGVRVLDLRSGEDGWVPTSGLDLAYRRSNIAAHHLVVSARLQLAGGDPAAGEATLGEIVRWRRANQPGGQNAGSVFTNPSGDSAGRLIDAAGGKGLRVGTAQVSPKHANFIVADAGGRADDVRRLMDEVVHLVQASAGVELHAETRMVGFAVTPTATAPPPVAPGATGSIDPRMKARRIAVQRDAGRRRLRRLVAFAVFVTALAAAWGATRSPLLDVDRIEVLGAQHTGVEAVLASAGLRTGTPMTDVDTGRIRGQVGTLPWVRSVSVRRHWPGTVEISVQERVAVATLADETGFATVDADGRVVEVGNGAPPGVPVIEGLPPAGSPTSTLDHTATPLLRVAAALPPTLRDKVEAVTLHTDSAGNTTNPPQIDLRLKDGAGVVELGSADHLPEKMAAATTMFEQVDLRRMAVMNVAVPSAPTLTRKG